MTLYAEVNGIRITDATIVIPASGIWSADVTLDETKALEAPLTLTVADLVLVGVAYRSDDYIGNKRLRIVGGAGGWRKVIPAKYYRHPVGLSLSTVLGDAAREAGEDLVLGSDSSVGAAYVREEAPAARTMNRLALGWYVGTDGKTYTAPRANTPVGVPLAVVDYDGSKGRLTLATEHPGEIQPGRTVAAPQLATSLTISSVVHTMSGSSLRTEVLTSP